MGYENRANLDEANAVAQALFDQAVNGPNKVTSELFTQTFSDGSDYSEVVFASSLAGIREWSGDKEFSSLEAFNLAVRLKSYEASLSIPRLKVDYDKTGATEKALAAFAAKAAGFKDKIIFDSLTSNSGLGPVGFDGTNLISTTHAMGGQTSVSNKTTSALSFSTYDTAFQAMSVFKGADSEPLGITPTHLVCGPKLKKTALEIAGGADRVVSVKNTGAFFDEGTTSASIVGAASRMNVFQGEITVVIWDRLTGTQDDYWYLMDLSKGDMPMLLKEERPLELISQTEMDHDGRFNTDDYRWSIEGDLAPAAGAYPLIYGGIL